MRCSRFHSRTAVGEAQLGGGPGRAPPAPRGQDLALSVPAVAERVRELREQARTFAQRHRVERSDDVALAISEAVTNVVVHAYRDGHSGSVELTGSCEDHRVVFVVADQGCGLGPRVDSPGLGMGLGIITRLAEEFAIDARRGAGTAVRMSFRVSAAPSADGTGPEWPVAG
jgi:serine/threonine-protein kinase RsbW